MNVYTWRKTFHSQTREANAHIYKLCDKKGTVSWSCQIDKIFIFKIWYSKNCIPLTLPTLTCQCFFFFDAYFDELSRSGGSGDSWLLKDRSIIDPLFSRCSQWKICRSRVRHWPGSRTRELLLSRAPVNGCSSSVRLGQSRCFHSVIIGNRDAMFYNRLLLFLLLCKFNNGSRGCHYRTGLIYDGGSANGILQ